MSIEAMAVVGGAKVGDQASKLVLLALANQAHRDGTAAFPSKATIADFAECTPKTVQRHLRTLEAAGWIRRGDQDLVAHYRADRRPVVYDIAMDDTTRALWADEARENGGTQRPPVDQTAESTPVDNSTAREDTLTPRADGHGGSHETQRGDTAVTPNPSMNQNPPSPHTSPAPPTSCPRHPDGHPNCRHCGTTPRQQAERERRAKADARRAQILADQAARRRAEAAAANRPPAPAAAQGRAAAKAAARHTTTASGGTR